MRLHEQCNLTARGPSDAIPGSEDEVERQLNRSWRICCTDDAKALRVRPNSVVVARRIEHRVIEHVERLGMEVELIAFNNSEVLVEAGVEVLNTRGGTLEYSIGRVAQKQPLACPRQWRRNPVFNSVASPDELAWIKPRYAQFAASRRISTLAVGQQRISAGEVCIATCGLEVILVAIVIAYAAESSRTGSPCAPKPPTVEYPIR